MKELQRTYDSIPQNAAPAEAGGGGLAAAQKKLQALLAAGDAAINANLSDDSASFLSSTKQGGGQ